MVFVHQVVAGSESHQPGIVGRGRDGNWACAANIGVAQLVGKELQFIGRETVVIPQDVVVGGATGSLKGKAMQQRQYCITISWNDFLLYSTSLTTTDLPEIYLLL